MAVDINAAKAAREKLEDRLRGGNAEIKEFENKEAMIKAAQEAGQMNSTALTDGECAEFLPMEKYQEDPENTLIITETSSNNRVYTNVYALVRRFFKNGKDEVAVKHDFINVGGIVRRHYDIAGLEKDANGKIHGAQRVLDPGNFNEKLEACKSPWNMLTNMLAGKIIRATRSGNKFFYQKFEGRQPVRDEYTEQQAMVYDFVK